MHFIAGNASKKKTNVIDGRSLTSKTVSAEGKTLRPNRSMRI
jgi:hypothetical protein